MRVLRGGEEPEAWSSSGTGSVACLWERLRLELCFSVWDPWRDFCCYCCYKLGVFLDSFLTQII